jgi:hypothetical protein
MSVVHIRRTALRILALGALVALGAIQPASAQTAYDGKHARVEVLGLHRWTLRMLQDSVANYVPGASLESAACMMILRDSLHFADALVNNVDMSSRSDEGPKQYLIIKVVEPADRARVSWARAPGNAFSSLRPDYAHVLLPVTDSTGGVWMGRLEYPLQFYARDSADRARVLADPRARTDAQRLFAFLDAHRSEGDRSMAMQVLRTDGFAYNRAVAAMVLVNFADRDSTWWALTDALRDPHEAVRTAAATVLANVAPHRIDWRPAAPTLARLLGGTNLPAMGTVFRMLVSTQVDPSLAKPLLRGDGAWLLAHLRAEYPGAKAEAHALLVQLAGGKDLGWSDAAWRRWIRAL